MADFAETLIRLVSRSARPDWTLVAVSQVSLRLVSRHRSDTRLDKLKYFVQLVGTRVMEYKTIQFEVVETTNPYGWKWAVFLDATRTRTGIGLTRADAVLDAELVIEKVLDSRRSNAKETSSNNSSRS
jgi:hypothetical protein